MKKPFETRTIEQAIETLIDYRGKTPPKTTSGVWLITAKVIKDGFIQNENKEFIAAEFYDEWMRRGLPKQWDVLVTTEAPLGEVAQIRTPERVALAQRVILLRGNPDVVHQGYLYQAMKGPFVQGELKARSSGTTVLGIKQSELWKVKIPWYPLTTQRKIAGVLSAYDDLIENNTRRIAILEEMAQAIYREWFVNFRFPGPEKVKLINSPLGKIPEGWVTLPFSQSADFVNGFAFKPEHWGSDGKPIIKIAELKNGVTAKTPRHSGDGIPDKYTVKTGDVLFSWSADLEAYIWPHEVGLLNQHLFTVLPSSGFTKDFLYFALRHRMPEFRNLSLGTTMRHIKRSALDHVSFVCPPPHLRNAFTELVIPMIQQAIVATRKVCFLRKTRDLLLPKLISGQLDVEELDIDTGEPLVEAEA